MPERIFITYTNATAIPYQGSTWAHHAVLNYIDSKGKHYTLEGVPERKFNRNVEKLLASLKEEGFSNGANNTDSPFQRLKAESHPAKPNGVISGPHTMIAEGDDLSSAWAKMMRFGDEVNSTGYEYRPYSQNSNSFAAAALKHAGFFGPGTAFPEFSDRLIAVDPVSDKASPAFVTGFDQRLTNPIDKPATMRHPVNDLEIPSSAINGNSDHRRQELFKGRFGIWAAPPGDNLNQPAPSLQTGRTASAGDKPVRYLSRRIAGKPEPSGFVTGSPAVPFAPSNEFLSPDAEASLDERLDDVFSLIAPSNFDKRISASVGTDAAKSSGADANHRFLGRRIASQPPVSPFDAGAPPVPFAPANDLHSSDVSVGERFGSRPPRRLNDGRGKRAGEAFSPDTWRPRAPDCCSGGHGPRHSISTRAEATRAGRL